MYRRIDQMDRNKIILFLVLFFALRLIVPLSIGTGLLHQNDSVGYNNYALSILKDCKWWHSENFSGSAREPGYPFFLAAVYFLFGKENFDAVCIFQVLLNILTVFIIYKFALKIFDKTIATIAFFWSGFYVYYIWYSVQLLRETLICLLFVSFLYYFYLWLTESSRNRRNFILSCLSLLFLLYTDLRYIYLFPCILVISIIYKRFSVGIKNFLILIFFISVLSTPWLIRNYLIHGRLNVINDYSNKIITNAYRINLELITDKRSSPVTNKEYPSREERKLIKRGFNPNNRNSDEIAAIKADRYPATTFPGRILDNFVMMWTPCLFRGVYRAFSSYEFVKYSLIHNIVALVSYGLLLPFALSGIIYLSRKKQKIVLFLLLPIFFHTIAHTLIYGLVRYRIPIDSILIILGAYGISITYRSLTKIMKIDHEKY